MARSQRQQVGDRYETLALKFLCDAGLELVTRNYSCRVGELDLVMRERDVIVFTEVRYRGTTRFSSAAATITPMKQQRIVRTAEYFVLHHREFQDSALRFDVVAIDQAGASTDRNCSNSHIQWLRDAFRPGFY